MQKLEPLQELYSMQEGTEIRLPGRLAELYGTFAVQFPANRPYLVSNFVESLDGIISLNIPGREGGGEISGRNPHDRMVMGLVRALADIVIITSTSLRVARKLLWNAETIYPELDDDYQEVRQELGLEPEPLHVVVTGSGMVDVQHRVLESDEVPAALLTTEVGAAEARRRGLRKGVPILVAKAEGELSGREIIQTVTHYRPNSRLLLSEGGAHLLGTFLEENCLDELFLTVAPQVVGQSSTARRTSLVEGHVLAPDQARWSELVSLKRGGNMLFLRYRFSQ